MNKRAFMLLWIAVCLLAFVGCGNNDAADANVHKDGDNVAYRVVAAADAPDTVRKLAEQCAGKTESLIMREGDDCYILLSTAEGAGYEVDKITVVENSGAMLVSVALKDAAGEAEGARIYKVEKMTFEDGVIFQMASSPAVQEETIINHETADKDDGENALDGSEITITVTQPHEGDALEGSPLDIKGSVEGDVTKVICQLVDGDGHSLGETEALVADLSHEYSAKLNYSLTDDGDRDGEVFLRVYSENESGIMLAEKKIPLKLSE